MWEEAPSQGQKVEEEQDVTLTPIFMVEVIKNGGKEALVLDCHYPEGEVRQEEDEGDIFSIREVSFQSTCESEWKDTNYTQHRFPGLDLIRLPHGFPCGPRGGLLRVSGWSPAQPWSTSSPSLFSKTSEVLSGAGRADKTLNALL